MNLDTTIQILQSKSDYEKVKKTYPKRDPWTGDSTRTGLGPREVEGDPSWKHVITSKGKRVTVDRINNPATFGGPELYETRNNKGAIDREFRDYAGAEIRKRELDRARFGLGKGYKALQDAEDIKYGRVTPNDDRLRNTTGGAGGTGGGGHSNG